MELGEGRLGRFSPSTRRFIVGCALIPCIGTVADYYLEWGIFGSFGRPAIALSFAVLFLVMRYLGPTLQQIREYRDERRMQQ